MGGLSHISIALNNANILQAYYFTTLFLGGYYNDFHKRYKFRIERACNRSLNIANRSLICF